MKKNWWRKEIRKGYERKKQEKKQKEKKGNNKDVERKEEFGKSERRRKATTIEKREEIGKNEKGRKEIWRWREGKREKDEERSPDNPWSHLSADCWDAHLFAARWQMTMK